MCKARILGNKVPGFQIDDVDRIFVAILLMEMNVACLRPHAVRRVGRGGEKGFENGEGR